MAKTTKRKSKTATKPKRRVMAKAKAKSDTQPKRKAKARRSGRRRATPDAALIAVTMTIDFPGGMPGDVQFIRRIDNQALANGKKSVLPGQHPAGWDVVSPTIRPIAFAVTVTKDSSGQVVLSRPNEKTGPDGKGGGADTFGVS